MKAVKTVAAAGLAAAAMLASVGAALAYPAVSTGSVNVRSGPGTSYAVRDSLRPGERVDVQRCQGSWCYVSHSGPDGWVSANYLSRGARSYAPPRVYVTPDYDDNYDNGYYYDYPPSIYIGPGYSHGYPPHHRPHNWHPGGSHNGHPGGPNNWHPGDHQGGQQGNPGGAGGTFPHRPHHNQPGGGPMDPTSGGQPSGQQQSNGGNPNSGNANGGHQNFCQINPEACMGGGMPHHRNH